MPLCDSFSTLMDYLSHYHRVTFGGRNEAECAARIIKMCNLCGGGIELG